MLVNRLLLTFVLGLFASFFGTVVGSGGLLSIPGLIFLGLSPQVAIATNRLAAIGMGAERALSLWTSRKSGL